MMEPGKPAQEEPVSRSVRIEEALAAAQQEIDSTIEENR